MEYYNTLWQWGIAVFFAPGVALLWCAEKTRGPIGDSEFDLVLLLILSFLMLPMTGWLVLPLLGLGALIDWIKAKKQGNKKCLN